MTDTSMTQDEPESAAAMLTDGKVLKTLEKEYTHRLVSVNQYLTDRSAAELVPRG